MSTDHKEGQQCFGKKEDGSRPQPPARKGFVLGFGFRWYRAWHGFWKDDCIDRAGLLSYTTLFGLIPLAVLVFSMWNLVGFSVMHRTQVDHLILRSFVPQTGYTILHEVNLLAAKGTQLGLLGIIGLSLTAVFLLHAVERHLNAIWGVAPHCWWCRVLRYLAMLVVAPLSVALLLPLLGPLQPLLKYLGHIPVLPPFFSHVLTFLVVTVMMLLLYKILPAAAPRWRDALLGGMTVALLFELDKFGLSAYLRFSTFETVYGALGAFPVFLLWLYVAWASILFGAEMAEAGVYSDQNTLNPAHTPGAPVKTDK